MSLDQTFAYQLQNLEVFRSKLCLVCFLKREREVNLARDMIFFRIPSLQFVPSLNARILVEYIRVDLHKAQERFVISAIVDVDAHFRVLSENITAGIIS